LIKLKKISSSTNFQARNFYKDQSNLLTGWKNEFSIDKIRRANYILEAFELNDLYDKNGYPTGVQFFRD
jgi:hypothetical protein